MTRDEIIGQWRRMMGDTVGADANKMWNSEDEKHLFADACDAFCSESRYFAGSMIDVVSLIPLVAGTRHYKLHAAIIGVQQVSPSWKTAALEKSDTACMDASRPGWLSVTGKPEKWLLDYEPGYLTLSHAPETSGDSVRLKVVRRQIDNESEVLEIPDMWHKYLKFHMAWQALFTQDSEVAGAASINTFKNSWDEGIEKVKREMLKMGRGRVDVCFF